MAKTTSKSIANKASKVMRSNTTSKNAKSVAASVLSQTKAPTKTTSNSIATKASKVLKDKRTSKDSKAVAGSALSQKENNNI